MSWFEMKMAIKVGGALSVYGIAISQNRKRKILNNPVNPGYK
jgi:hypothetical protein